MPASYPETKDMKMSITDLYGKYGAKQITCDNCGDGFEAEDWEEAQCHEGSWLEKQNHRWQAPTFLSGLQGERMNHKKLTASAGTLTAINSETRLTDTSKIPYS